MNGYFVSFGKPKDCMVCSLRSFGGFSGVLALCFECNTLIHCSCKGNRLKLISISALLNKQYEDSDSADSFRKS